MSYTCIGWTANIGKWICPAGVNRVQIECFGRGVGSDFAGRNGGGGGGYAYTDATNIVPGAAYYIVPNATITYGPGPNDWIWSAYVKKLDNPYGPSAADTTVCLANGAWGVTGGCSIDAVQQVGDVVRNGGIGGKALDIGPAEPPPPYHQYMAGGGGGGCGNNEYGDGGDGWSWIAHGYEGGTGGLGYTGGVLGTNGGNGGKGEGVGDAAENGKFPGGGGGGIVSEAGETHGSGAYIIMKWTVPENISLACVIS